MKIMKIKQKSHPGNCHTKKITCENSIVEDSAIEKKETGNKRKRSDFHISRVVKMG